MFFCIYSMLSYHAKRYPDVPLYIKVLPEQLYFIEYQCPGSSLWYRLPNGPSPEDECLGIIDSYYETFGDRYSYRITKQ